MSSEHKKLTDQGLKKLPPAAKGSRHDIWDTLLPGFGVRITDTGKASYVVLAKWPGDAKASRRVLAKVDPRLPLADARDKAREWLRNAAAGKDPEAEVAAAKAKATKDPFDKVAEQFIGARVNDKETAEDIRRFFVNGRSLSDAMKPKAFGARPIASITAREIADIVLHIAETRRGMARNTASAIKSLFKWAATAGLIDFSPAAAIDVSVLIGSAVKRDRILTETELVKLWRAALTLRYPEGPVVLMLILTGCRKNEVAQASWDEFDLRRKLWTIPAARMKGKKGKRREHVIPLTPQMLAILNSLPRHNEGKYLFSLSAGVKPVMFQNKHKQRIDQAAKVWNWRLHDLRRTMRSGLSPREMKIEERVAEAMIAHVPPGEIATYDKHKYLDEKRDGFLAWDHRVEEITGGLPRKPLRLAA